jgi:hypothetical protein
MGMDGRPSTEDKMNDTTDRSLLSKVLVALVVIAAGVLLLANNLVWQRDIHFGDLWPLLFVLAGVSLLGQARQAWQFLDGAALIALGLLVLESRLHLLPNVRFRFWSLWPLALIYVGLRVLFWKPWTLATVRGDVDKDRFGVVAIFGGGEYRFDGQTMRGGEATAIFGGCKLDLRNAEIAGDSMTIQCKAVFGGIEMLVPPHWNVTVQGMPVLGGFDNKAAVRPAANGLPVKTLIVEGTVLLGGIEIKN